MIIKHNVERADHLAMAIQVVLAAMVIRDVWDIKQEAEWVRIWWFCRGRESLGSSA